MKRRLLQLQQMLAEVVGQVAEWLKAAARKGYYTSQVVSEVRILLLPANLA